MSDLYSEICRDEREYERLCERYGEEIQFHKNKWGETVQNTYGKHAEGLRARARKESEEEWKRKIGK